MTSNRLAHCCVLLATMTGGAGAANGAGPETFSIDVTNILYTTGTGEFAIDDSFDTYTQSSGDIVLIGLDAMSDPHGVTSNPRWEPESGPGVFGGSLVSRSGDIVLRTSATGDPKNPPGDDDLYAGRRLWAETVGGTGGTNESHLAVTADTFDLGNDTQNIVYGFSANLEDPNQNMGFSAGAGWFTGWFNQTYIDHGLGFTMSVYQWDDSDPNAVLPDLWESGPVVVPGSFDPATTEIQVGADLVQGSSTDFSGWYRINGGSRTAIDSHTFPSLDVFSFPMTRPGVTVSMNHIPIPGDINGDDVVDVVDLGLVGGQWGTAGADPFNADIAPVPDGDGIVDVADLGVVGANWTGAGVGSLGGASVPAPGAGVVGITLIGVFGITRRLRVIQAT